MRRFLPRLPAIGLLLVELAGGCTLVELDAQTRDYATSTVLVGRVETGGQADGPIVVGAYTESIGRPRLAHQTRLHEHGGFELIVPPGEYRLFAFADRNDNGQFDPGEPSARHAAGREVSAGGAGMIGGLDMVLGDGTNDLPRFPPALRHSTQAGAPIDLDAAAFSAASGRDGYWRPMEFFRQRGGNLYFVEPYDPARTPVLFVHGAAGSPQDWRHQIAALDRSRYQAWVYFYPSGASVESMSNLLYWKLLNLQLRHRYPRLLIVAHSMGGLVVRRCLLDSGSFLPQVALFVTLSTPWAGEASADTGVRLSPAVVPSWLDMQPDGAFMRSLFDRRLPGHIEYDLLFGHRGAPGVWRPNNDGTVTLASQLRRAAQEEARRVYGYDEDHDSILVSPQVTAQLHALLDRGSTGGPTSAVTVQLVTDPGTASAGGLPALVLWPHDAPDAPTTVVLSAAAATPDTFALAPGRYTAGVVFEGFVAEPRLQEVEVPAGASGRLTFRLRPQGALSGYVAEGRARPAGARLAADASPRIERIRLQGAGVERVLVPDPGVGDSEAFRRVLQGRDVAWSSAFAFVDLPTGNYELTIDAEGHATHRSRHQVTPGRSNGSQPIVLEPAR